MLTEAMIEHANAPVGKELFTDNGSAFSGDILMRYVHKGNLYVKEG